MRHNYIAGLLFAIAISSAPALAQQEQGDQEVGLQGFFFVNHRPVLGTGTIIGSYGTYFRRNQYLGVSFGPTFTFSRNGEGSDVSGIFNANYRYLFGATGAKVYPFVGLLGGGNAGKNSTSGYGAAEVGVKSFLSQKVSLEFAYQFNVGFQNTGVKTNFINRTSSQVLFGFKYIL
jgi:hypothetical protein